MSATEYFSPAKINLFLAVTGRRPDGFHDLVSVVAPISFGDVLHIESRESGFTLTCTQAGVPLDESNLILKAAKAFAETTNWRGGAAFHLEKKIPMGAGLGGGSSNAVAALRALNALSGGLLDAAGMEKIAAELGSDCPLFLSARPVIMRGRGERVTPLAQNEIDRISGQRLLVFKPAFGVATPWAFGELARMARAGVSGAYLPEGEAERWLADWRRDAGKSLEALLLNTMEKAAFAKYLALPALLARLNKDFGLSARMSGSGSACFALLDAKTKIEPIEGAIRDCWGESAFVTDAKLL